MVKEIRLIVVVGFLIFFLSNVNCQVSQRIHEQLRFRHITVDDGIGDNRVRGIGQDKYGFIWIGSLKDVARFDGYSIKAYQQYYNDSVFTDFTETRCIFSDSEGTLWAVGDYGICYFDWSGERFVRFSPEDIEFKITMCPDVDEDGEGNLWFVTNAGILKYNIRSKESFLYEQERGTQDAPNMGQLNKTLVASNGDVWYGYLIYGAGYYSAKEKVFKQFNGSGDVNSMAEGRVERIYEDKKGNIWIGHSNNGISRFDYSTGLFTRYFPDSDRKESGRVRGIIEDKDGNLWFGTQGGLYLFDHNTETFKRYAHSTHPISTIGHNSIQVMFIDNQEMLWLGTFAGGVSYTSLNSPGFIWYSSSNLSSEYFLNDRTIYCFEFDNNGNIWVGTEHGGLNFLDRETGKFTKYTFDPDNINTPRSNNIKGIYVDNEGVVWFGTYKGGVSKFNPLTRKFKHFIRTEEFPQGIDDPSIFEVFPDRIDDNILWIGATRLIEFDTKKETFTWIDTNNQKYSNIPVIRQVNSICNAPGNRIVFGTTGLVFLNRKTNTFEEKIDKIDNDAIDNVSFVLIDKYNYLWAAINTKYIIRMNIESKEFIKIDSSKGLPSGVDYFEAAEDNSDNLWLSSSDGIFKLEGIIENPDSFKVHRFDKSDNIQSRQFIYHSKAVSDSGEILFGGINGFNTFYPKNIKTNYYKASVVLTKLEILGKEVKAGQEVMGRRILDKHIIETQRIRLPYKAKYFSIHFAGLHFVASENNSFKYKLEGFEKDWKTLGANIRSVTYSNIPRGKYVFKVNAANNDGIWNDEPLELEIIIDAPIWKTWWFWSLALFAFIALVFVLYFIRMRSVRRRNIILERTVKKRTEQVTEKNDMLVEANYLLKEKQEEILVQNEELANHRNNLESIVKKRTSDMQKALEKAKESDALKSTFLANMSHEVRTPMNAIVGFTNLLNDADVSEEEKAEYIQVIQSNSNTLLKIIDEILDLSLIESNQLKIVKKKFNLNIVLDNLYSYYFLDAQKPEVEIRKNNELEGLNLQIDSDGIRVKQILTNLLDNARKYTDEGYVELGAYKEEKNICLYVKDTGKGIPQEKIDKIFKQFIKVEDNNSVWVQGLGLGLAISQRIAGVLGFEISVESEVNKGSTFSLKIPLETVVEEKPEVIVDTGKPLKGDWHDKTILIAEDVEANFFYLKTALKRTKTKVIWAKDGEEALQEVAKDQKIDLILMDIKMPKMDGYQAAKKIKEQNPNQIIVAQTAYARPQEKYMFYDENFDEYLAKPIDKTELFKILNKFL